MGIESDEDNEDDDNDVRPSTPLEEDCCGNGCNPCIFDVHRKLMKEWQNRRNIGSNTIVEKNLLTGVSYKPFLVTNVQKTSEDCLLMRLMYKGNVENTKLFLKPGQYVILHFQSLSRPFTPISWMDKDILLLIKIYPNGKFSSLINNITLKEEINIRGPYGDFKYETNSFRHVVMFGIGSGIASLYPIAKSIVEDDVEETRIEFVAGFHSIHHVPLKEELRRLTDSWNFTCTLHLTQQFEYKLHGIRVEIGRLNKTSLINILKNKEKETTLILICGTPQFNQSVEEWSKEMGYSHIYVFS